MRLFTIKEANEMIPKVRPILAKIQQIYEKVGKFREPANNAAKGSELGGGGMESGSEYVSYLFELGKLTSNLDESGIQIKDFARGLIDFPSERKGKIVLLCWQLGEKDEIEWWHDIETGFAGRRPL